MNDVGGRATWDVLKELGFEPDSRVISDGEPGLSFDFGSCLLKASQTMSLRYGPVVLFTGVLTTRGSLARIEFEMQRSVASRETCAAWIVWHLDQLSPDCIFEQTGEIEWVIDGRRHMDHLPWVIQEKARQKEMEEYEASPKCGVQRQWLRRSLNTLSKYIASATDDARVTLSFDGSVLQIRCGENVVVTPAKGTRWPTTYAIPAGKVRRLPSRLMRDPVYVGVWRDTLSIDRHRYRGIVGLEDQ